MGVEYKNSCNIPERIRSIERSTPVFRSHIMKMHCVCHAEQTDFLRTGKHLTTTNIYTNSIKLSTHVGLVWSKFHFYFNRLQEVSISNKKVLLRERKRHTARRVAIAISCYSGGGGGCPLTKKNFPVWTCIKPNLVSKNFPFTGGGVPRQKFFFQFEHVSSQIWYQKFFPLLEGGGGPWQKIFFLSEHVSSQIWCQKIFPLLRPGTPPWTDTHLWKHNLPLYIRTRAVKIMG